MVLPQNLKKNCLGELISIIKNIKQTLSQIMAF